MLPTPVLRAGGPVNSVAYRPAGRPAGGRRHHAWRCGTRGSRTAAVAPRRPPGGRGNRQRGRLLPGRHHAGGRVRRRADAAVAGRARRRRWPRSASRPGPSSTAATWSSSPPSARTDGCWPPAVTTATMRLWSVTDPARPRLLATVPDSGTYVFSVAFSPDGTVLAAASADGLTRLWDIASPARPTRLGRPLGGPGQLRHLGGVQPGRPHPGGRQRGQERAPVERRPTRPAPVRWAAAHRPGRVRLLGGVQPGRAHAGRRGDRRHRLAVAGGRPGPAQPAGHADRPGRARVLGGVLARMARPSPRAAPTAPSGCGTPGPPRRPARSAAPPGSR